MTADTADTANTAIVAIAANGNYIVSMLAMFAMFIIFMVMFMWFSSSWLHQRDHHRDHYHEHENTSESTWRSWSWWSWGSNPLDIKTSDRKPEVSMSDPKDPKTDSKPEVSRSDRKLEDLLKDFEDLSKSVSALTDRVRVLENESKNRSHNEKVEKEIANIEERLKGEPTKLVFTYEPMKEVVDYLYKKFKNLERSEMKNRCGDVTDWIFQLSAPVSASE